MAHLAVEIGERAVEKCDGVRLFEIRAGKGAEVVLLHLAVDQADHIQAVFGGLGREAAPPGLMRQALAAKLLALEIIGKLAAKSFEQVAVGIFEILVYLYEQRADKHFLVDKRQPDTRRALVFFVNLYNGLPLGHRLFADTDVFAPCGLPHYR